MFKYIQSSLSIRERADLEAAQIAIAEQQKQNEMTQSNLDYVAMMADIELPEMDEEEGFDGE